MQDVTHHIEDDQVIVAFAESRTAAVKNNADRSITRQTNSQEKTMDFAQFQPDKRTDKSSEVHVQSSGVLLNTNHLENALEFASNGYDLTCSHWRTLAAKKQHNSQPTKKNTLRLNLQDCLMRGLRANPGPTVADVVTCDAEDNLRRPLETSRGRMQRDPPVSTHNQKGGKVVCVQSSSTTNGCPGRQVVSLKGHGAC